MAHTIVQNISARLHRSPGTGMTTATGTDRDQRSTGNGNANANGNANGDDRDQRSTATSISHRPSTTDRSPRPTDPSPRSRSTSPRSPSTSRSPPGGASDDQQAARSTPASTPGADSADAGAGPPASRLCKDDFTLLKTLGTGTFARVWLARVAPAAAAGRKTETPAVVALKVLRKADVVRLKQVEHVRAEREVLARVTGHPFITALVGAFQTRTALYLALEFCAGGEVFSYLRRARRFAEGTARFYAAEIVLVLGFLHERHGVAYRDLKPENVLLDAQGHVKLVDFGFAKKIDSRETYTLCGTPEYLAPEVIRNTGHTTAVDWWALGILIYEFLVGQPPFWDANPLKIYEQIVSGKLRYPSAMPADARALVAALCTVDVSRRLGHTRGGAGAVRRHAWFAGTDWEAVLARREPGPIVPHVKGGEDARNFDEYGAEAERGGEEWDGEMAKKYDGLFEDF